MDNKKTITIIILGLVAMAGILYLMNATFYLSTMMGN